MLEVIMMWIWRAVRWWTLKVIDDYKVHRHGSFIVTQSLTIMLISGLITNASVQLAVQAILGQAASVYAFSPEEGMEILKYDSTQNTVIDQGSDWSFANASTQYINTDVELNSQESIRLNHYGDNAPDIAGNGNWWDDDGNSATDYNWNYRQCFDVTNNSSQSIPIFQHYLQFDTSSLVSLSKMKGDGSDIRFIDQFGTQLRYSIREGVGTNNTFVWLRDENLPASSTKQICMYYGNPSAPAVTNEDGVFELDKNQSQYVVLDEFADNQAATIGSLNDNNTVSVSSFGATLQKYELLTASAPISDYSVNTTKPIGASFLGNSVDALNPASAAGTQFAYRMDRGTNSFSVLAPQCTSVINVFGTNSGGGVPYQIVGSPFTVVQNTPLQITTTDTAGSGLPDDSTLIIESTNNCPVLVSHRATNGDDSFVLYPVSDEWLGVGTGSYEIAARQSGTSVTVYSSTGASTSYSLNRGDNVIVNDTGSQGTDPAVYVIANIPVGVKSIEDGDGNESVTFVPISEMGNTYVVPQDAQYVAIAGEPGRNITASLYYGGCTSSVVSQTQSVTVSTITRPSKMYFGSTTNGVNIPQGTCIRTTEKSVVTWEPAGSNDEQNLWSYKQNRELTRGVSSQYISQQNGNWNLGLASGGNRWRARLRVDVTNTSSTTYTNIPVYMRVTGQASFFSQAQADGGDIRMAGAAGNGSDNYGTYYVDYYEQAVQYAAMWVQMPTLPPGTTSVYVYYRYQTGTLTTTGDELNVFSYPTVKPTFYFVDDYGINTIAVARFASLAAGNTVIVGSSNYSLGLTQIQDHILSTSASVILNRGDIIYGNGPIMGDFDANTTDAVAPFAYAGTRFSLYAYRGTDEFSFYAPYVDSKVVIESSNGTTGWNFEASALVSVGNYIDISQDIATGKSIRITSSDPVVAVHRAGVQDSKLLYPVDEAYQEQDKTYELFGVSSRRVHITAVEDNTNIKILRDDGTSTGQLLQASNNYFYGETGLSQGQGRFIRIIADKPIAAHSNADSDGNESIAFIPRKEMSTRLLLTSDSQYVSLTTPFDKNSCSLYGPNNSLIQTITTTPNGLDYPNGIYFTASASTTAVSYVRGSYIECVHPVMGFTEKVSSGVQDETSLLGLPQGRATAYPSVTVQDIDDVPEEGLYVPNGNVTSVLDLSNEAYSAHIVWNSMSWVESSFSQGIVAAQIQTHALPCAYNAGYTMTPMTNPSSFAISFSDKPCLQYKMSLTTNDRQYTPDVDSITFNYSLPTLLDDIIETDAPIGLSGQGVNKRILKIINPPVAIQNGDPYFLYRDAVNGIAVNQFKVNVVEVNTYTSYSEFNLTSLPTNSIESLKNTPPITGNLAVYAEALTTAPVAIELSFLASSPLDELELERTYELNIT